MEIKTKTRIDEVGIWNRELRDIEIASIYKQTAEDNLMHVAIVTRYKKGFWSRVFFQKEIVVYVNGEQSVCYKSEIGTVSWFAILDQSKVSKLQYPFNLQSYEETAN